MKIRLPSNTIIFIKMIFLNAKIVFDKSEESEQIIFKITAGKCPPKRYLDHWSFSIRIGSKILIWHLGIDRRMSCKGI